MVINQIKRSMRTVFRLLNIELRRYRPQTDIWLAQKNLLRDVHSPIVFDVGANIGQTLEAYMDLFPNGEIYCFEPFPDSFAALRQAASRYSQAHAYPLAISDSVGERTFYVNAAYHATNSLLPRPVSGPRYYPDEARLDNTIAVTVDTLDSFVQRSGVGKIDILKMDIQGGEMSALRGAEKLLDKQSAKVIVTEIMFIPHYEGGGLFHEINEFLVHKGYSLFGIYDLHYADNGQLRFADAIYINNDMRDALR